MIIDELIYISFVSLPNYIRKFLYLLHDQIDLVPSTNPSPNGVKSTRVTIKRPFRAWAIVTAQYSWRGTWYPPSPLKSRIQRRSTMNSIKWTEGLQRSPMAASIEGRGCFCIFPSVDRYPKTKRIRSIFVLNAALTYILETIDLNSVLSRCSRSVFLKKIRLRLHSRPAWLRK